MTFYLKVYNLNMISPKLDYSLNYANHRSRHMHFICDFVYNPDRLEGLDAFTTYALTRGCVLGQPLRPIREPSSPWPEGTVFGMYISEELDKEIAPDFPVDPTLNRSNASGRNLRWIDDIVYDRSKGFAENEEPLSWLIGGRYTLGSPNRAGVHRYGLYYPRASRD